MMSDLSDLFIGPARIFDADGKAKHFISRHEGYLSTHVSGFDTSGEPWLPHEVEFRYAESLQALHQI